LDDRLGICRWRGQPLAMKQMSNSGVALAALGFPVRARTSAMELLAPSVAGGLWFLMVVRIRMREIHPWR